MSALAEYVTGSEFATRVNVIAGAATTLQQQLQREQQFLKKHWAEREKVTQTVANAVAGLHGDLEGVLGQSLENVYDPGVPAEATQNEQLTS